MAEATIKIEGMSCMHCVGRVKEALDKVDGVTGANVEIGSASVSFDESKTDQAALENAVTEAGSVDPDDVAAALEGLEFDHGSGPAYIRACDHQLFQPIHITKMRSEEEAGQSPLWPEYAFREVLSSIDVTEDIERTCEELGFTD